MQFRLIPSIVVFLGSYLPLGLILLAQDMDYKALGRSLCWNFLDANSSCRLPFSNPGYSITIFSICLVCFALSLFALRAAQPNIAVDIVEARYTPADLMNYTLPYVVSFMSLDYQETGKFMGLIIFLAWMFWITHKAGQLILNPVFTAFGWRYYEVTYTFTGSLQQHHGRALSREPLTLGQHQQTSIQDVLIFRPKKEDE